MSSMPTNQRRVLIIDDEQLMLSFLGYALKEYGYGVLGYRSSEEALKDLEAAAQQPHIALVDLGNGRKDFLTIKERFPKLPLFLMASDLALGEEQQLRDLGAAGILHKPFSLSKVLNLLKTLEEPDEPFTL
jgi:DNA-binding response OmpR family regulator